MLFWGEGVGRGRLLLTWSLSWLFECLQTLFVDCLVAWFVGCLFEYLLLFFLCFLVTSLFGVWLVVWFAFVGSLMNSVPFYT